MKSSISTKVLAGLVLLGTPSFCFASVRITEIMYDLPGSDAGREWVEVMNDGVDIDLKDYKFFNKDGGHLLKAYGSGSTILPQGAVVVIADKPDLFLIDNPSYAGILIDSSFSLVSADTVGIKDGDGAILDSIAYASSMGANGDSNSLSRSGVSSLSAGVPTPGSVGGSNSSSSASPPQSDTGASATSSSSSTFFSTTTSGTTQRLPDVPLKHITVDGGGDRTVTVGAASLFTAKVFGTAGEPVANPRLLWNFGNGGSAEGKTVSFTYEYPGVYNLMVTGATGEYSSSDRVEITALPAALSLIPETNGTLFVLNKEKRNLDVSLWRLVRGSSTFLIPAGTVISGGQKIPFSADTTKLPLEGEARLEYPNGTNAISQATETPAMSSSTSILSTIAKATRRSSGGTVRPQAASVIGSVKAVDDTSDSPSENTPWVVWFAGALGLGVLGAAGVVFLRHGATSETGTSVSKLADTYEIIE